MFFFYPIFSSQWTCLHVLCCRKKSVKQKIRNILNGTCNEVSVASLSTKGLFCSEQISYCSFSVIIEWKIKNIFRVMRYFFSFVFTPKQSKPSAFFKISKKSMMTLIFLFAICKWREIRETSATRLYFTPVRVSSIVLRRSNNR